MSGFVWMFSGQGSQYFGMGRSLFDADTGFREHLLRCDEISQVTFGRGFLDRLFPSDPKCLGPFDDTRLAKAALFSLQYALGRTLLDRGARPRRLLGYSLGEFVALAVSGATTPARAMGLLAYLAGALEDLIRPGHGGMTAVLDRPELLRHEPTLFEELELACINSDTNFVVAGPCAALDRCEALLRARGLLFQRQPVEYAYHTTMLDPVHSAFLAAPGVRFSVPDIPVSLCSGHVLRGAPSVATLWTAVRGTVRFGPVATELARDADSSFLDLGPSGTLAANLRSVVGAARAIPILSPFGRSPVDLDAIALRHGAARAAVSQPDLQKAET